MKVLLIEENPKLLQMLRDSLVDLEFQVFSAPDVDSAMETFNREKPELVVTGNKKPELDGLAILTKVMEIEPQTRVVIASPEVDLELACAAVNLHAEALYRRPVELRDIIHAADQSQGEAQKRKQREEQHSRLALEYSKLRQAYQDLRSKT